MMYKKKVVEHVSQVTGQRLDVRVQEPKTREYSISTLYPLPFILVLVAVLTLLLSCAQDNAQGPDGRSSDHAETSSSSDGVSLSSGVGDSSGMVLTSSAASAVLGIPGTPLVYGGQTYQTVEIGSQTWMAENLNYATASGSYCDTSTANYCDTYGRLYDWATAQTVCPAGWHLPTDAEWQSLEITLGMDTNTAATIGMRGTDQGTQLKANSSLWSINTGTNTSGFSALPAGCYCEGVFGRVGHYANFWTATESESSLAWGRGLDLGFAGVFQSFYGINKTAGMSVRCLKDSN